jgi:hypothetical protein
LLKLSFALLPTHHKERLTYGTTGFYKRPQLGTGAGSSHCNLKAASKPAAASISALLG